MNRNDAFRALEAADNLARQEQAIFAKALPKYLVLDKQGAPYTSTDRPDFARIAAFNQGGRFLLRRKQI